MNTLRFKFWDNIDYMTKPYSLMDIQEGKVECTSDVTVLQYSGFNDSNDVAIYEGDIVYVAGFSTRAKVIVTPEHGAEFEDVSGCHRSMINAAAENDIGRIMGNIYQHPEILLT